jgi:Protein of unknown function (DUF2786)
MTGLVGREGGDGVGRNNQQRRAAKARARARKQQGANKGGSSLGTAFFVEGHEPGRPTVRSDRPSLREQLVVWLERAMDALSMPSDRRADAACAEIVALAETPVGRRVVTTALTEVLTTEVDRAWRRGWQPADLSRVVGRSLDGDAQLVLADAVAAQLSSYAVSTIAPRWPGQLREMGAVMWWSRDSDPVSARSTLGGYDLASLVPLVIRVAHLLARLPALERHDPLPGSAQPHRDRPMSTADGRILARVRALLAKAESTTFEAEAETFTTGAQALMARHSIDAAMLAASGGSGAAGSGPAGRRIGIDPPYEAPKVLLLDVVATANRCRSIWSKEFGFVTLVGYESDLEAAETIFTSLLVQANHAMQAHGTRTTRFGQSRTRAFRQSFLMSYAHRIGERLREVIHDETEAAVGRATRDHRGSGQELVRVLSVRAAAVDEAMVAMFPHMVQRAVGSTSDVEGWHAGRRAADEATLNAAHALNQ